ncbi:unnamed protein product [Polarella glacialis]|uniref:N-acetyltransferase domain-containing protein n=1 Tax=Polarella glacialis TaxID=89957 RepID=A0A813JTE9_POLGL|nr:unnamed protein product [Polarella glacialis]CAE8688964.1 unnamed protein product [Polarella glacialis]
MFSALGSVDSDCSDGDLDEDPSGYSHDHANLENPVLRVRVGSWIEAVSCVVMRESESLQSQQLQQLPAFTVVQVQAMSGRRMLVRVEGEGRKGQGWVSSVALDGTLLWEPSAVLPLPYASATETCEAILVRPFWSTDRAQVDAIEHQCFSKEEISLNWWLQMAKLPEENVAVFVGRCTSSGKILAYCGWALEGAFHASLLHVLSLAVDPAHRGQRIGEQLLRSVEQRGCASYPQAACMTLFVRADNLAAQRLYTRHGFIRVALIRSYYSDCDAWEMMRELGPMCNRWVDPDIATQLESKGFDAAKVEQALRWSQNELGYAIGLLTGDVPERG